MSAPVEELLIEYALGTIDAAERQRVEEAIARSPQLMSELRQIEEALADVAMSLPPIEPEASSRGKLLAAVEADPFAPFIERLAKIFDLGVEKMREVAAMISDATKWEPGPIPGLELIHFAGGPRVADADTGFARLPAGFHFPLHRHEGDEIVLILQGTYTDLTNGEVHRPGDIVSMGGGTEHAFLVGKDEPLVFAVALRVGLTFPGVSG